MWYIFLFLLLVFLDRATKFLVMMYITAPVHLTSYLTFNVIFNRGITWGFFHSSNDYLFWIVTGFVVCITLMLAGYAYYRWQHNQLIFGEVLVCAGSVSNIIDRFYYHGVVDFIWIHYGSWINWGIFNIADVCIVLGVGFMVGQHYLQDVKRAAQ